MLYVHGARHPVCTMCVEATMETFTMTDLIAVEQKATS